MCQKFIFLPVWLGVKCLLCFCFVFLWSPMSLGLSCLPEVSANFVHMCESMCICSCVMCVVMMSTCVCKDHRRMSGILLYHCPPFPVEMVSLTEPGALQVASKPQWTSCHQVPTAYGDWHMPSAYTDVGIRAQVLKFVRRALLPSVLSLQPLA